MYNMRSSILSAILILSLTVFVPVLSHVGVEADLESIRVPGDYPTIQTAINAASVGSMILVDSGTYHEHVMVNKTVKLVGFDRMTTIIDGDENGTAITVTADDVLINGFTVQNCSQGADNWVYGSIHLVQSRLSTISGNIVTRNVCNGIVLNYSDNNKVLDNIITLNGGVELISVWGTGISLLDSDWNTISGNIVAGSVVYGIGLEYSYANLIRGNVIEDNGWAGIGLYYSPPNTFHHNSLFRNTAPVDSMYSPDNAWDDGAEGNYWDDYVGLDDGSNGRVAGDGVGDTDLPHAYGVDNYPLVQPPKPIPVLWENSAYPVAIASNSTLSAFRFIQPDKKITFNVRGPSNTTGYFKLDIPKALLSDNPWKVLLNNTDSTSQTVMTENQTHTSILCTYNQDSSYDVQIIGTSVIPEFPAQNALTLILFLTFMLAAILNKRNTRC
jgi:parallel beta-helix repeat protein